MIGEDQGPDATRALVLSSQPTNDKAAIKEAKRKIGITAGWRGNRQVIEEVSAESKANLQKDYGNL